MKQKKLLLLALFALGLVISCSKDDGPSTPETPTISGFTPSSGPVGTPFVINGTNFSTTASKNTVKIGTTTATVTAATATKITTTVPQGASTAKVSVTVGGKTATSTGNFTVTEPQATNKAPEIAAQGFDVAENITESDVIGTVAATDPDQDPLTFSMDDASGLFVISASGGLSLAEGKTLDFETTAEHTVTVSVADGNGGMASADITITVTDIPEIAAQGFEAAEDIADTDVIGTIMVSNVTFTITTNDNDFFEIDASTGALSLAEGKSLDFETAEEHTITVEVTDGVNDPVSAEITITVTNVIETLAEDPASFVTTWVTLADNESILIGVDLNLTYDYTIDWGDGTVEDITDSNDPQHVYAQPGTHTVAIKGLFPAIRMGNGNLMQPDLYKLESIEQWGTNLWATMQSAFKNCTYMVYNATDVPDLSQVTDMGSMFVYADAFNGDLSGWDVSNVTDMGSMFAYAKAFNGDLSGWDVSNVTSMTNMFNNAISFEGMGLSTWDVGNVTDMSFMFYNADAFNGDLSGWDVSNVTDMSRMFARTESFNGDLSGWDTGSVEYMHSMFENAISFEGVGLNSWDTGNVLVMESIFSKATSFDQNLGSWNFSSLLPDNNGLMTKPLEYMLSGSGLSPQNYDATLMGWSSNPNTPDNLTLGASGLTYCTNFGSSARQNLINNKGWTIDDDGANCNP